MLVEDEVVSSSVLSSSQVSVENVSEGEVIIRHSQRLEGFVVGILFTFTEINDGDLVLLSEGG